MKFRLNSARDRRRAYRKLAYFIARDIVSKRLPTFHVLHLMRDGGVDNHYMTPISLEPVDEHGKMAVWGSDFKFFLRLMLRLKKVVEVEYDDTRPAVIFTYADDM